MNHESSSPPTGIIAPSSDPESRRSALRRSVAAATAAVAASTVLVAPPAAEAQGRPGRPGSRPGRPGSRPGRPGSQPIGPRGRLPERYPGQNARILQEIRDNENDHVGFFTSALGSAARPRPTFRNVEQATPRDVVIVGRTFENNIGTRGALSVGPAINDPDVFKLAVELNQIEARHSAFMNAATNDPISLLDSSFESLITPDEMIGILRPFIVSLNGGPPLEFSLIPSEENDIAIMNFFLAAEFLEAEFYNTNVPKFFGRGGIAPPGPVR